MTDIRSDSRTGKLTVRQSVLAILENHRGIYVSGEEISEKLGVSRAAIWKAIQNLREEGFAIDAATNKGYNMRKRKQLITDDTLRYALPANLRAIPMFVLDHTDSTNLQAKKLLLEGRVKHGSTVIANRQSAGRGRLGRSFFSPEDGLYLSIIIKPEFDMRKSVLVTLAAATAVAETIRDVCDQYSEIKWVNDIYIDGRKVCGILTEATTDFESGQIDNLIIGIGINTSLKGFPKELLKTAGAVDLNRADALTTDSAIHTKVLLAVGVIKRTLEYTGQIGRTGQDSQSETTDIVPDFLESYRSRSILIGRNIKVYKGAYRKDPTLELGGVPARVLGIDDSGGLEVIYTDGSREILTSGEVSIRL